MMKAFIKKTQFGFQFKLEGNTGFNYFPDAVKLTPEGMKAYLQSGGRDEPELIYVNQEDRPAVHYKIVEGKTFAGQKYAIVNHEKTFLLDANEFVPDSEKLAFLQDHSSMKQDQEASKFENDEERVKYYLNNVTEETKVLYKHFMDEKLTPDVLRELCENNAKTYGLPAEVEFKDI